LVSAASVLFVAAPAAARTSPSDGDATQPLVEVIVKTREPAALRATAPIAAADGREGAPVPERVAPATYLVPVRAPSAASAARAISREPGVAYAEPNAIYRANATTPNDPCATSCANGDQWYLARDHASDGWRVTHGSSTVVVAVLDTPVHRHPDLAGKLTVGPDFSTPDDFCGSVTEVDHGTHVAGIIGAATNNGAGIAALGWNTRVLGVAVLNPDGCGTTASIVQGIRYAVAHHARIINLSLGGPPSSAVQDAVEFARANGVLIVAAAGNAGWTFPEYPAAYDGVLAVGGTTRSDRIAPFSNRGTWVDVAAPGVDILSTTFIDGVATYAEFDGTSFAAPQVSATAALLVAENPCMTADDIARRITATARPLPSGGVTSGLLDTGAALTPPARGFRFASVDGGVFTRGGQCFYGSAANVGLRSPIVGMTSTTTDGGYWLVAADGGVFAFGNARFHGSAANLPLAKPVVAMQATPSGKGYWLVASDGGVFSYGDAHFFGSTGAIALRKPVLGMAVTRTGRGYWLVASDGGVFAFGDARFFGSTGAIALASPVAGMTSAPRGDGYLLVGGDGGVFAFGKASYRGSAAGASGGQPTTGIAGTWTGRGYWVLHADGTVQGFGDATPYDGFPTFGAVAINGARRG
jgi:subtilisin family serine protease